MKPLEINNLNKSFKDNQVLKDVNLSVDEGQIFGLIGLNGVGKTTMIKIILGLLDKDSGNVNLFGKETSDKDSRKKLSFLPEKFYPSQFLKGREFLELTCSYYKKSYNHDEARRLADILKLKPEVLDNKVSSYSKGMGQKLGLLSSLLIECPFLMLDEPMSGLDPSARIALKDAIKDYAKPGSGKTVFFSSHILSDIDEICDNIAILHGANIIYQGKPEGFKKEQNNDNLERAFLKAIEA
jgi:ABC-2 type transport system ATP-binding protein